jgi:hypothetical protein
MTEIDQAEPKGNGIAQHSSASNEHYTPRIIVEVAREAMGSIELDPASCELANRENVRAARFFTKEDEGLGKAWDAKTIFVNPPGGRLYVGGKRTNRSQAQAFWHKAVYEWNEDRHNKSIVFLGFTLELLRLSQHGGGLSVLRFPFCVLRERTDFEIESKLTNGSSVLVAQGDPTHANVLACITSQKSVADRFKVAAEKHLGECVEPVGWIARCTERAAFT